MDKQKQIEELEKDIAVRMAMAKGVAGSMNNGVEGWLGEYLIGKGWIKPAENAVVLTEEKYEELQIGKDFNYGYHNGESNMTSYYENIRLPEIRKEMAEKFTEMLKSELSKHQRKIMREDYQQGAYIYMVDSSDIEISIDKICKKIIEKENK